MPKVEEEESQFSVLAHAYVPRHQIVPPEEAKEVLAKCNARPEQLPYILASDPAAKEINAKPGDLVRITRSSETAGQTTYYRFVVEG